MFNKKTMVLYCGGASSLAPNAPASPGAGGGGGGGGGGPPHPETGGDGGGSGPGPSLPLRAGHLWGPQGFFPEGGRSLMGGGSRAGGPLSLIGPLEGAPREAIGCGAETPRPASLALPERELDGCEPDSGGDDDDEEEGGGRQEGGRGGGRGSELEGKAAASSSSSSSSSPLSSEGIPSPCSTLDSLPDPEPEEEEEEEEEEGKEDKKEKEAASSSAGAMAGEDHLRRFTLEVVGRYLHEAAGQGAKDGGGGGGGLGGVPKFSLQGLLGRLGTTPQGEAEAAGATRALETLRRVGDGILEKHQLAFQGMLRKMEIKKEEDLKTMSEVATEVFRDGIINWGRIVTLISFGAFVAKHLKSINLESSINTLTEIITDVLVTDKREWLVSHNAWEGFVKFFHVEDIEGGIRSVLMTFAGVAGLGAGLAFMIR